MARETQLIYDEIIASKEAEPGLAELNSTSQTAVWRLWAWITAICIHTFEIIMDAFRTEVELKIAQAKPLTVAWYQQQALNYQSGQLVTIVNGVAQYDNTGLTDEAIAASKIVTRAAVVEGGQAQITVKVAKGAGGNITPLTSSELVSFGAYMDKIQGAGDHLTCISLNGDKLTVSGTVYYDGIVSENEMQSRIEAAVNGYLKSIPFNGEFYTKACDDAIQGARGVRDFTLGYTAQTAGVSPVTTVVARRYATLSGWMAFDLNGSSITFIPFRPYAN